ncbi:MAG: hypothetical protein ABW033_03415, partial [Acidimicrobiia bacterium]
SSDAALGALTIADVAHAANTPIEQVARVHFALAGRLELDWLRDRIAGLPRADRWQTEARAALRDDLADCHRALTESVLATNRDPAAASGPPLRDTPINGGWFEARAAELARYERVLEEIRTSGVYGLAQLTAARRALRDLTANGEPDPRPI